MSDFQRPHCKAPAACAAKSPVTHCRGCAGSIPEVVARRINGVRRARAAADAIYRALTKVCARCGSTFSPPKRQMDVAAWEKRQFCGKACAARGIMERPDVKARQVALTRERFKDPVYRAKHAAAARVNAKKAALSCDRTKGGATRTRNAVGWIPVEMRKSYVRMRENYGAAEAKRMIREHLDFEARRAVSQVLVEMRAKAEREKAQAY